MIEAALDKTVERQVIVPSKDRAATENIRPKQLEAAASQMTPEQIAAIYRGLQILAGYDEDFARDLNGVGFSKIDAAIGHSLANMVRLTPRQAVLGAKLVSKYRRQLPFDLVATAKGVAA